MFRLSLVVINGVRLLCACATLDGDCPVGRISQFGKTHTVGIAEVLSCTAVCASAGQSKSTVQVNERLCSTDLL